MMGMSLGNGELCANRASQVAQAKIALGKACDRVERVLASLEEQLGSVLRPERPVGIKEATPPEPPRVELAEYLQGRASLLHRWADKVEELRERCEL